MKCYEACINHPQMVGLWSFMALDLLWFIELPTECVPHYSPWYYDRSHLPIVNRRSRSHGIHYMSFVPECRGNPIPSIAEISTISVVAAPLSDTHILVGTKVWSHPAKEVLLSPAGDSCSFVNKTVNCAAHAMRHRFGPCFTNMAERSERWLHVITSSIHIHAHIETHTHTNKQTNKQTLCTFGGYVYISFAFPWHVASMFDWS